MIWNSMFNLLWWSCHTPPYCYQSARNSNGSQLRRYFILFFFPQLKQSPLVFITCVWHAFLKIPQQSRIVPLALLKLACCRGRPYLMKVSHWTSTGWAWPKVSWDFVTTMTRDCSEQARMQSPECCGVLICKLSTGCLAHRYIFKHRWKSFKRLFNFTL